MQARYGQRHWFAFAQRIRNAPPERRAERKAEHEVLGWLRALDAEEARSAGVGLSCCTVVALWVLVLGGVDVDVPFIYFRF